MPPSALASCSAVAAPRLFDGEAWHEDMVLRWADGRIVAVERRGRALPDECFELPAGTIVAPGLIDVQVNGGGGALLNDAPTPATIRTMAAAHRRHGTTGLLPTLITDAPERLAALAEAGEAALAVPGVMGFHLEGPFISTARKGIHPERFIRPLEAQERALLERFGRLGRSIVTLAPECVSDADIAALAAAGLKVCVGHSEASGARMLAALAAGVTGVTHLFNAMSQMSAREPGVVGAALGHGGAYCGVICDGAHVDPLNLRAAWRALGPERLMLVTDAMPTAGADIAGFTLHGREIRLVDGILRGPDSTLAGAHLTMLEAVAKAEALMGVPLGEALAMASRTPAAFLGLGHRKGALAPGHDADWIAFAPGAARCLASSIGGQVECYA